ncbi:MAG TPA: hypothetical protein VNZ01_13615 [Solirubrobacteraceae bacterium]|jgi:hypothetical protein|nr:hypothetical protein [Solirubrobacteraceae bacterium]
MTGLTFTPVFAHLGHWYVSLPVFGGPVVIIAIAVKLSERRERRRAREGDTTHLRVAATKGDDRTVLTVRGTLDYPALLSIESEMDAAARVTPHLLLDLRNVTTIEKDDFVWSVVEMINSTAAPNVAVLIGAAPALDPLRKALAVEGVTLVDNVPVTRGAPAQGVPEAMT